MADMSGRGGTIIGGSEPAPAPGATSREAPKKVSNSGGARPGAGRNPKHPNLAAAPEAAGKHGSGRGRKRKVSEVDQGDDQTSAAMNAVGG